MEFSNLQLSEKIEELKVGIQQWADSKELWIDSSFTTFLDYHQDEPNCNTACVLVLLTEGGLWNILNGYSGVNFIDEFDTLVEEFGFYSELHSSCCKCPKKSNSLKLDINV